MLTRTDLREYQERAAKFIRERDACALWMDMGLGKSITTLTAFSDLLSTFDARRMLVVAPLRVARDVWHAEVENWAHTQGLSVSRIIGTREQRIAAIKAPADIYTINRENIPWLESLFIQGKKQIRRWPWDVVVLDESQSFKTQGAMRSKSMRRLRRLFHRIVELTGTPAPNGYADLWFQIYLLDFGQRLGRTETAYRLRWFDPPGFTEFGKWTLRPGSAAEIEAAISDIVLTLRAEDYLDLPPVNNNFIKVKLPEPLMKRYKALERESYLKIRDDVEITALNAAVLVGKLLQFANGAMYVDGSRWEHLHDLKLDALFETLDGLSGPTLIAYEFVSDLERISKAMPAFCGKEKTWDVLKTEESVKRWNNGEIDYLLLHPASAGHGLNLQHSGSENIVWMGSTNNLEHHQQLNARLAGGHRRGKRNITIHYIVAANTADEDMISLISRKELTQAGLKSALVELANKKL